MNPGAMLGPYQVLEKLGEGGMGEVYKARDTRLDRSVAIKVLPAHVSADPERRARFEREAKTIAGLTHPHICTLYDVGESEGSTYLVMEHLTGETLAQRLERGPLPLEQALSVATEIADALAAAHRQGVIHRDLKPGNVMLTKVGAKLLDFGLAKLKGHGEQPAAAHLASAPTQSTPLTGEGMIVGTLQYMAPEQLEGKPADARTDLWALGAIIYEMLTGRRPFESASAASLIANIMNAEPAPLPMIQPLTPPVLDRLVRDCLAKSPDDRPDTAHDVSQRLRWIKESGGLSAATRRRGPRGRALRTAMTAGGVAAAAIVGWLLHPGARVPQVSRLSVDIRPADALSGVNPYERILINKRPSRTAIALSPDGRLLVFAGSEGEQQQLYARPLDRDDAWPMKGTERADMPFFSPDGRFIGFWAEGVLRKIPATGGAAVEICKTSQPSGASWGADGQILFAAGDRLWQVGEAGGTARALTTPDAAAGERRHGLPHVLPNGKGVLYTAVSTRDASGWATMVLPANGRPKMLLDKAADARYLPTGHLLFAREGKLRVAPFDLATLRVTGGEVAVGDDVMQALNGGVTAIETGAAQVAVADAGVLAYVRGGIVPDRRHSIGMVGMDGTIRAFTPEPEPHAYLAPQLSPDGERVVLANSSTLVSSLWVYDLRRGFLSQPVVGFQATFPVWTPDGRSIVFAGGEKGHLNLFRVPADGTATPQRLTRSPFEQLPACWAAGGRELVFLERRPETANDILAIPIAEPEKTRVLVGTRFGETYPAVSPDGRWLAYVSDASGRDEVYVRPYAGGEAVRVSADGAVNPVWSRDGHRLLFVGPAEMGVWKFYASDIKPGDGFAAAQPKVIWQMANPLTKIMGAIPLHSMDLMPDGKSCLVVTVRKDQPVLAAPTQIELVLNWFEELKAKVPTTK